MRIKNKLRFTIFVIILLFTILLFLQILTDKKSINIQNLTNHIVVDAGHGGNDPGTVGVNGAYEKDIALEIAIKLADELENQGYMVTLLRDKDFYIDNINRAKIANDINASLYLSIHCNAVENKEEVNGVQTLYYPGDRNSKIAKTIHEGILNTTKANDKDIIQREDLIVLNQTKMPSFIIESGFLSNEKEAELLKTEKYQNSIVNGILDGINKLDY